MNLEKRIRFIEDQCILASHPECKDLEEAYEKEILLFGCQALCINDKTKNTHIEKKQNCIRFIEQNGRKLAEYSDCCSHPLPIEKDYERILEILGLPCGLARVLNAFKKNFIVVETETQNTTSIPDNVIILCHYYLDRNLKEIPWKLLNSNGTSCTIRDQDEETVIAISNLLGYKE